MRVFVYCVDGCDRDLVERWSLSSLMQEQYGTFKTIINKTTGMPMSAQIWGSFLTGRVQDVTYWQKPRAIFNWLTKLQPYKPAHWIWKKFFSSLLETRMVRYLTLTDLEGTPLWERVRKVKLLNFPFVDYDVAENEKRYLTVGGFEEWLKVMTDDAVATTHSILRSLHEDWLVFLAYEPILDGIGHLFLPKRVDFVRNAYCLVARLLSSIQQALPSDTLVLVVSDHGMNKEGEHSEGAFYSFSRPVDFVPTRVTDFYDFLVKAVEGGCE